MKNSINNFSNILNDFLNMYLGSSETGYKFKPSLHNEENPRLYNNILNTFRNELSKELLDTQSTTLDKAITIFMAAELKSIWLECYWCVGRHKNSWNAVVCENNLPPHVQQAKQMLGRIVDFSKSLNLSIDFSELAKSPNNKFHHEIKKYKDLMKKFNEPRLDGKVLEKLLSDEIDERETVEKEQFFDTDTIKLSYNKDLKLLFSKNQQSFFTSEKNARTAIECQLIKINEEFSERALSINSLAKSS